MIESERERERERESERGSVCANEYIRAENGKLMALQKPIFCKIDFQSLDVIKNFWTDFE